jgi:hypothetical protein
MLAYGVLRLRALALVATVAACTLVGPPAVATERVSRPWQRARERIAVLFHLTRAPKPKPVADPIAELRANLLKVYERSFHKNDPYDLGRRARRPVGETTTGGKVPSLDDIAQGTLQTVRTTRGREVAIVSSEGHNYWILTHEQMKNGNQETGGYWRKFPMGEVGFDPLPERIGSIWLEDVERLATPHLVEHRQKVAAEERVAAEEKRRIEEEDYKVAKYFEAENYRRARYFDYLNAERAAGRLPPEPQPQVVHHHHYVTEGRGESTADKLGNGAWNALFGWLPF